MVDVLDVQQSLRAAPELAAVYLSAFGAPGYDEEPARAEQFGNEQLPQHSQRDVEPWDTVCRCRPDLAG